jgi:DNA polymerase-3 subunit gamma/tau
LERAAPSANVQPSAGPFLAPSPFSPAASGYAATATLTEGALAVAPENPPAIATAPSLEALRQAVVSALADAGHSSAAQLLGAGTWALEGATLRIEAPMGKKMLSLTVNPAAEKIVRQELQRLGASSRFMVVPGEGSSSPATAAAPMPAPLAGSIQQAALAHPLVQRAQEIFKAEVRSVVDLRRK